MKHPFKQRKSGSKLIREFSSDVAEKELVWHRDRLDRHVKIQEGVGWKLQLENKLPVELEPGLTYYIPKNTYHRVMKGKGTLVVEIKEDGQKMKITKSRLRKIIAEERKKLDEQGFHSMSPAGKALANSIKGKFVRMYPDAKVGIDGRGGFITVNGVKAIDMSQATGRGMSDEEMIEKMHAAYAETQVDADVPTADSRMDTFREGKMKITKRQLKRIIKEEKAVLEQSWRENPAKIRRQRRIKDRQSMIDTMTFKQLKRRAFDSALFIQGRLDTGQYEYEDIWEVEIPRLADYIDAAKVKAAEEGVTYDDVPEVRHRGGILDLSRYSLGLPATIKESKLRKIIRESLLLEAGDFSSKLKKIRALLDKDEIEDAAEMYANMNEDPSYFGGELEAIRFEYDETRDFFENAPDEVGREFEELAYEYLSDRGKTAISSSSHKNELLAISDSFMTQVTPDEVKHITYQPRVRKGQLANVNMEDNDSLLGNMATGMTPDEAKKHGTTLEKVMATLDSLGATKRTRRKPVKMSLPYYD